MKGDGGQQDYGFRVYDNRLGRFLSVDPLTYDYPFFTPYQFSGNSPIGNVDLDGLEPFADELVTEDMRNGKPKQSTQNKNSTWPSTIENKKVKKNTQKNTVSKQKVKQSDPLDRAGLELSGDINLGGYGGFEALLQVYGRSETDMEGNAELVAYGSQSTSRDDGPPIGANLFFGFLFDLSGDIPSEYQTPVAGQVVSIEPYLRCSWGLASFEYNTATNEIKLGLGFNADSNPLNPCEGGVKEKVTLGQITNDPILNLK